MLNHHQGPSSYASNVLELLSVSLAVVAERSATAKAVREVIRGNKLFKSSENPRPSLHRACQMSSESIHCIANVLQSVACDTLDESRSRLEVPRTVCIVCS